MYLHTNTSGGSVEELLLNRAGAGAVINLLKYKKQRENDAHILLKAFFPQFLDREQKKIDNQIIPYIKHFLEEFNNSLDEAIAFLHLISRTLKEHINNYLKNPDSKLNASVYYALGLFNTVQEMQVFMTEYKDTDYIIS